MVFCGKPSGGCHACRVRKTKCDKIPEGCSQCRRAKRECPGYRNAGDLVFRDESSNVVRKAKAKEARKKAILESPTPEFLHTEGPQSVGAQSEEEGSVEIVRQQEPHLASFMLAPAVEDLATGFFISNFVVVNTGRRQINLGLIGNDRIDDVSESLLSSMKAVGLAGFAHAAHAPHLQKNARYQYLKAIQSTNSALRDPVEVRKDSTLLSIMILGIFESITGCHQRSLKDWSEHINGAAAVIKLRGPDQIKSVVGRRLLVHVASSLIIACLNRDMALPKHIIEYMSDAYNFVGTPDPMFTIQHTAMLYSTHYAEVAQGKLTDPQLIISRALALDARLVAIAANLPPAWDYITVLTNVPSETVFQGKYHLYEDYWTSQMWNSMRTIRLMIHEMVRQWLLIGFSASPPVFSTPEHTAQLQTSIDTIYEMISDILCTVPQHVGYFPQGKEGQTSSTLFKTLSTIDQSLLPSIKMSGGSFVLWPLWLVGLQDLATEDARQFAITNLRAIGKTMGIRQGFVLADILEAKSGITVWKDG